MKGAYEPDQQGISDLAVEDLCSCEESTLETNELKAPDHKVSAQAQDANSENTLPILNGYKSLNRKRSKEELSKQKIAESTVDASREVPLMARSYGAKVRSKTDQTLDRNSLNFDKIQKEQIKFLGRAGELLSPKPGLKQGEEKIVCLGERDATLPQNNKSAPPLTRRSTDQRY